MIITHARIMFHDRAGKFYTKAIKYIKCDIDDEDYDCIRPKNENDFDPNKTYICLWSDCGDNCTELHEHFGYYEFYIFYLGGKLIMI